jgi:hypothetical protein
MTLQADYAGRNESSCAAKSVSSQLVNGWTNRPSIVRSMRS